MPMIDAMSRVADIRSTLDGLGGQTPAARPVPVSPAAPPAPFTDSSDAFTKLLTEAAAAPSVPATKAQAPLPAPETRASAGAPAGAAPGAPAAAASADRAAPVTPPGGVVKTVFPMWSSPANGTTVANPSGATGGDIVETAKKYLGVPYVWGGNNPKVGLDCSSLVQTVMRDLGMEVPRTARQQMSYGTEVPRLADARPGDLIVTRGGRHIGIYIGDNKMLHAPRPGQDVQIREMFETDKDIATIRRIVHTAPPSATPADAAPSAGSAPESAVANMIAAAQSSLVAGNSR